MKGLIVFTEQNSISEQKLPDWIKNNAKWWANKISDEDFVKSIQYLVKKGIIREYNLVNFSFIEYINTLNS